MVQALHVIVRRKVLKWVSLFSTALLLMVPSIQTRSATFDVKPSSITIEPDRPIAQVAFSSLNARAVVFDASVERWAQTQGQDVFSPADDLIVLPPVFSIQPYGTTLLRVARRQHARRPTELSSKGHFIGGSRP
jgi:fimbrial chaperone protein